jgi:hypothetical protein
MWRSTKVEPTLTAFAYSDILITGGFVPGGPAIENDQGQVWGKGVGRLNFIWSKNFESFIEGSIFGTSGLENVVAYSGTLGIRLKFWYPDFETLGVFETGTVAGATHWDFGCHFLAATLRSSPYHSIQAPYLYFEFVSGLLDSGLLVRSLDGAEPYVGNVVTLGFQLHAARPLRLVAGQSRSFVW